jgi:ParB family chromosome partitioning protein
MSKKSFKQAVKEDFKVVKLKESSTKGFRSKGIPGARLLPLSEVLPDPNQPRRIFDNKGIDELAESIRSKGIIEPVTVRKNEKAYILVTGERRVKAAKLAGLEEIPCVIKDLTDDDVFAIQLIENLQRENLRPVEEAQAFRKLSDNGVTQGEIAKQIGKSQPYISQSLTILKLPEAILKEADKLGIPKDTLLQLTKAANPEHLWEQVKQGDTAKQIKETTKKNKDKPTAKPWKWQPENKSFTIQIKFQKQEYSKAQIITALEKTLEGLKSQS